MLNSKYIAGSFLFLCLVTHSSSSPIAHNLNEGRGIGSTLWGWISYPFSWWSYDASDIGIDDQLNGSTVNEPFNIEIGKHNVTVWCNDQTCTTMRCDKFGCSNVTCNIYDTDLTGECRSYNTIPKPDVNVTSKPTELLPKPAQDGNIDDTSNNGDVPPKEPIASPQTDEEQNNNEKPLQLEAVLSSTVTDENNKGNPITDKTVISK